MLKNVPLTTSFKQTNETNKQIKIPGKQFTFVFKTLSWALVIDFEMSKTVDLIKLG